MSISNKDRIVITGIGVVSPLGIGKQAFWKNALGGVHGFDYFKYEGFNDNKTYLNGVIKDFQAKDFIEQRKSLKVMSRDMQIALAGAKLALDDARFTVGQVDPTLLGVSIGAGMIHCDLQELGQSITASLENNKFTLQNFGKVAMTTLFPLWLLKQLPNMVASHISIIYNAQGPSNTLTTASAAGLQAIGEAARIIERGDAKVYICGGSDVRLHLIDILKYKLMGLYCENNGDLQDSFCPYDKRRSGFIPGEAAVIVIIEDLDTAIKRGAHIYAEILGYGSSAGVGFREKDIEKRAYIESLAITQAIEDAHIQPSEIDYIVGHGCSSVIGDVVETLAYKKALGDSAKSIPISSPTSMVGYVGAATGSLNLACAVMAMQDGKIPPTVFLKEPDPECDLDYVPKKYREHQVTTALVNTFDFYGQGAALVIKKFEQ